MKPFFAVIFAGKRSFRKKSHKFANKKEKFCYNKRGLQQVGGEYHG